MSADSASRSIQSVSLIQYTRHLPRAPPALDARPQASVSEENSSEAPHRHLAHIPQTNQRNMCMHSTLCIYPCANQFSPFTPSVTDRPAYATPPEYLRNLHNLLPARRASRFLAFYSRFFCTVLCRANSRTRVRAGRRPTRHLHQSPTAARSRQRAEAVAGVIGRRHRPHGYLRGMRARSS